MKGGGVVAAIAGGNAREACGLNNWAAPHLLAQHAGEEEAHAEEADLENGSEVAPRHAGRR